MGNSTLDEVHKILFEHGSKMIWAALERAAEAQGCAFRQVAPAIDRGSGSLFVFAFELDDHLTQITVHIEDIFACARVSQNVKRTVTGVTIKATV